MKSAAARNQPIRRPRCADCACARSRVTPASRAILAGLAVCALRAASLMAQPSAQPADAPKPLRLRTGDVTTDPAASLHKAATAFDANSRYVIQLDGPLTPDRSRALRAAGVALGDYLPPNAFIVRCAGVKPDALAALSFVRWVGRYQNAWKIDPDLAARLTPANLPGATQPVGRAKPPAPAPATVRAVVSSFDGIGINAFSRDVAAIAPLIGTPSITGTHVIATVAVTPAALARLVALAAVQFVQLDDDVAPRNNTSTWIVQSNISNRLPLWDRGLHGEGQLAGVIDTPPRLTHCAFSDAHPIGPTNRKIQAYYGSATSPDPHGTHTLGTLIGEWAAAGGDACYDGMAFSARASFRELSQISSASITLYNALLASHADGARTHSNSWGGSLRTYVQRCVDIDTFSRDFEDDLVLFAINNSGTITNPENAKNCLAVTASGDSPNQGTLGSGGTGPTLDNRRKPEVAAPGAGTLSADFNTACGIRSDTGTSMACPVVAAMAMLTRQYFMDGFYPSGRRNAPDSLTPSAALLKAVLINSAVDMTGVFGYPSDLEGWGRLLMDDALFFDGDARKLWINDRRNAIGLTTGNDDAFTILNLGTTQPLNITMVFTDVPGTLNAAAPVVNNLDLEVTDPAGNVFRGNVFNGGGQSVTGGAFDPVNNVEQVHRTTPAAGVYVIKIKAAAVSGPAADPRQGYALAVTGDIVVPAPAVYVSLAGVGPDFLEAGQPTNVDVRIQSGAEVLVPGSPMLEYRFGAAGPYSAVPLAPLGNNLFRGTIPAGVCGQTASYYFTASGDAGSVRTAPMAAPGSAFSAPVLTRSRIVEDGFEADAGWTVFAGAAGGNLERAAPQNTQQCSRDVQPGADHTAGSCSVCFVTGAAAGANNAANDLDAGPTRLVSPLLDLSPYSAAAVNAYVWFYDGYLTGDSVTVEVSADNGMSWTPAATLVDGRSEWRPVTFRLDSLVALTHQVRIRFVANDLTPDSIMEVLIDDVTIDAWSCNPPPLCMPGDLNRDGLVDGDDLQPFVTLLGLSCPDAQTLLQRCAGDFTGDGIVAASDVTGFVALLLGQ